MTQVQIRSTKRSCNGCTKCCEGNLSGIAYGHAFYKGRPCFFSSCNGCSIYEDRPENPCKSYSCNWLENSDVPEWMKPDKVNAIVSKKQVHGIDYLELVEAGDVMQAKVLSWFMTYALGKNLNILWQVEGGNNWLGSKEFVKAMKSTN